MCVYKSPRAIIRACEFSRAVATRFVFPELRGEYRAIKLEITAVGILVYYKGVICSIAFLVVEFVN